MQYVLFYITVLVVGIIFMICIKIRPLDIKHLIIGLVTIGYSLVFDVILGNWLGLYYYLDHQNSALYTVLSGVFLYPLLNIIYVLFFPKEKMKFLSYTALWIIGMLLFEYTTVLAKIVVFTGWKPVPWSLATYAATYLWIYAFYKYLSKMICC